MANPRFVGDSLSSLVGFTECAAWEFAKCPIHGAIRLT